MKKTPSVNLSIEGICRFSYEKIETIWVLVRIRFFGGEIGGLVAALKSATEMIKFIEAFYEYCVAR